MWVSRRRLVLWLILSIVTVGESCGRASGQDPTGKATSASPEPTSTSEAQSSSAQSSGTSSEPPDAPRHHNATGIAFRPPSGWKVIDGPRGAMLVPPGLDFDPSSQSNTEAYTITGSVA